MVYNRATWLPAVLKAAGITVVEHAGWETRGLSTSRPFNPRAVVWHHDASAKGDSPGVPAYMISNYDRAGAQIWVDRYGRWHLIASGRAAHAGVVLAGKPNNETSLGIETDHTSGEAWPDGQLKSLRRGTAAILKHWGVSANSGLHFHKSICSPPGRKIDPDGLNLTSERFRVGAIKFTVARVKDGGLAAIRNAWISRREVSVLDLRHLQRSGRRGAKEAAAAADAIEAAMRTMVRSTD